MPDLDDLMNHPKLQEFIDAGMLPHDFRKLTAEAAVAWLDAVDEDLRIKMANDREKIRLIEAELTRRGLEPRGKR